MGYHTCLDCGWSDGVHDVRGVNYQHPWLVLHRATGAAIGCWSRAEARRVWEKLKNLTAEDAQYAMSLAN